MPLRALQGRRIAVIGQSGSGKSTLARALAAELHAPHVELDALNWGPGWTALSTEDPGRWTQVVTEAVAGDSWITDGNYSQGALPVILPRATDMVWLDFSRGVVMSRVLRRSFIRAVTGQELWPGTGNRESFGHWLQKEHPIRWTWDTFADGNERRAALFRDPGLAHVRKHRLPTPALAAAWFETARSGPPHHDEGLFPSS
jgi:adenylate kinase family enzyme